MKQKNYLILTAIGHDQVGLVEKLSQFVSEHNCNIEDSKMAVFCGEFAVIMLISGNEAALDGISRNYREIESQTSLSITLKAPAEKKSTDFFHPYKLTATCMDHPGIVYQISGTLSGLGVNIESMETKTYFAPQSGTPLFRLEATLAIPFQTDMTAMRNRFAEIQRNENIDIELSSALPARSAS